MPRALRVEYPGAIYHVMDRASVTLPNDTCGPAHVRALRGYGQPRASGVVAPRARKGLARGTNGAMSPGNMTISLTTL